MLQRFSGEMPNTITDGLRTSLHPCTYNTFYGRVDNTMVVSEVNR